MDLLFARGGTGPISCGLETVALHSVSDGLQAIRLQTLTGLNGSGADIGADGAQGAQCDGVALGVVSVVVATAAFGDGHRELLSFSLDYNTLTVK